MADSKKKTTNKSAKTKKDGNANRSSVAKTSKSVNTTDNEKLTKIAIEKYKDIPLGELYEDLNGTQVYKDILQARRDELLRAKSIVDAGKRKIAIAKTNENTIDIEFRYQKNETFKNHYVPSGNFRVVGASTPSDDNTTPQVQRERVMSRSQERTIADPQTQTVAATLVFKKDTQAPQRQVNITSTLEQRQDRVTTTVVGTMPQQQPQPAPAQPAPAANPNAGQMVQRPVQPMSQAQPAPAPAPAAMMQPQPQQPAMAPMMAQPQQLAPQMQQPQQLQPQQQPQPQPQAAVVKKDPEAYKKSKLWPLYEQIELISKRTKSNKLLLYFSITLGVLLALLIGFIIIWGFAANWNFDKMGEGTILEDFGNLFRPFIK